jgi:hypothetical protein
MDSPQSRAPLRVVKSSSKSQPKTKSGKAAKNNYSNFAAAGVLAVAVVLLALSLSHLAAGEGARPSRRGVDAVEPAQKLLATVTRETFGAEAPARFFTARRKRRGALTTKFRRCCPRCCPRIEAASKSFKF